MKKGQKTFTTWAGAIVSLIIFAIIMIYGSQRFVTYIKRDDTKYETYSIAHEDFRDNIYKGNEVNFHLAFNVWGTNEEGNLREFSEEELDGYLEIFAIERLINQDPADDELARESRLLKRNQCTQEQLIPFMKAQGDSYLIN